MIEVSFDPSIGSSARDIFPNELCLDDHVVFHGTSSVHESEIEADGFVWRERIISVVALQRLKAVYEAMGWRGDDSGGYVDLASFSLGYRLGASAREFQRYEQG